MQQLLQPFVLEQSRLYKSDNTRSCFVPPGIACTFRVWVYPFPAIPIDSNIRLE
ncbi:hypothetical protein [Paenibacillus sp. PL91]|uniref:hypothetical protein n=1 Tax=Paenibacillus sp. PL91 TaxID=2729538 RepID=UPI00145F9DEB|nr:hypothetical protein [Paenibacillus sp. PL91]MBC9199852.1 hypothetical protein [Paenibacillus sp. PL91]